MNASTFGPRVVARGAMAFLFALLVVTLLNAQAPAPAGGRGAGGQAPGGQGRGRGPQQSPASQKPPQTVTPQTYPPELVQRGQALFAGDLRVLSRPRRDGRRDRSRPHALDARGRGRARRQDHSARPHRACRQGHAAAESSRVRSRGDRGVHSRHQGQGGLARRQPSHRRSLPICRPATRRSDSNTSTAPAAARSAIPRLAISRAWPTACRACSSFSACCIREAAGAAALAPATPVATIRLPSGETITGKVAYRDEFNIAITDAAGYYRSWPTSKVKVTVDNPLDAHIAQLAQIHERRSAQRARVSADAEVGDGDHESSTHSHCVRARRRVPLTCGALLAAPRARRGSIRRRCSNRRPTAGRRITATTPASGTAG